MGFGWGLRGDPDSITEYRRLRKEERAYPGDEELNRTLDHFENMTTGDYVNLVWTRSPEGEYYLCEITGGYRYSRDAAHERAGVVNFAPCVFYHIGSAELVPAEVVEQLDGGGVIRFVHSGEATELTRKLWQIVKENQI